MDINTALIAAAVVVLVIHHLRQSDCRDQIRSEVNQARRDEINRCQQQINHAFVVWNRTIQEARNAERRSEKNA